MGRRSADRAATGGPLRRHPHRLRALQHGGCYAVDVLSGAGADHRRHGAAEGQRQRDRWAALRDRRRAPGRWVLDLLYGHQCRELSGAARVRLSRPARQLAYGVRSRRYRHVSGPDPVCRRTSTPRPRRPVARHRGFTRINGSPTATGCEVDCRGSGRARAVSASPSRPGGFW